MPGVALCSFEGPPVRVRGAPDRVSRRFPVAMARGKHLFPFRTEQLSPSAPMVLGPQGPGRVGRRRFSFIAEPPSGAARGRWGPWLRMSPADSAEPLGLPRRDEPHALSAVALGLRDHGSRASTRGLRRHLTEPRWRAGRGGRPTAPAAPAPAGGRRGERSRAGGDASRDRPRAVPPAPGRGGDGGADAARARRGGRAGERPPRGWRRPRPGRRRGGAGCARGARGSGSWDLPARTCVRQAMTGPGRLQDGLHGDAGSRWRRGAGPVGAAPGAGAARRSRRARTRRRASCGRGRGRRRELGRRVVAAEVRRADAGGGGLEDRLVDRARGALGARVALAATRSAARPRRRGSSPSGSRRPCPAAPARSVRRLGHRHLGVEVLVEGQQHRLGARDRAEHRHARGR